MLGFDLYFDGFMEEKLMVTSTDRPTNRVMPLEDGMAEFCNTNTNTNIKYGAEVDVQISCAPPRSSLMITNDSAVQSHHTINITSLAKPKIRF